MKKESSLKRRVMTRIFLCYTKNTVCQYPDYFMFGIFSIASFVLVSFSNVFANMPKNSFAGFASFFLVALRDTSWIIQILIAGFLVRASIYGFKVTQNLIRTKINWPLTRFKY